MSKLKDALSATERAHKELARATQLSGEQAARTIINLRSQYAHQVAVLIREACNDETLVQNRELANEFNDRFREVRRELSEHQAHFRLHAIEQERSAYASSAARLAQSQAEFFAWAREALRQA